MLVPEGEVENVYINSCIDGGVPVTALSRALSYVTMPIRGVFSSFEV